MVEHGASSNEVAGSSPASPASNLECERILNAVIDYNLAEVHKKMELHGIDFDMALEMQRAVMIAETYPR